jgi:acetylornithine deacetylase/succinyl-diaminopimelate desuccinylase-like protein
MTDSLSKSASHYKRLVRQGVKEHGWSSPSNLTDWVIQMAIDIQQIPAPTFHEKTRAAYIQQQFQELKLEQIRMDERYNVYGVMRGSDSHQPALMLSAHSDTVFDLGVDLSVHRKAERIYGPGLGDNSLGVAGMLAVGRTLREKGFVPACDIYFVCTSREEGLGDLGGMRLAYDTLKDHIGAVINIEGLAYGYVYNKAIAVRRYKISVEAEGGHSWVHFGRTSAVHGLVELGHRILKVQVPNEPRTTFNIGVVSGGLSINTIAANAEMWLDMRSETDEALADLEEQVRGHIDDLHSHTMRFSVDVVSDRPSGHVNDEHPLVQMALAILQMQGTDAGLHTGSTDGNIPMSHGCPTVTIGMTTGGNAHRSDEYIEVDPVRKGMEQLLRLTMLTCDQIHTF